MINRILGFLGVGAEEKIQEVAHLGPFRTFTIDEKTAIAVADHKEVHRGEARTEKRPPVWVDGEPACLGNRDMMDTITSDWPRGIRKVGGSFAVAAWNNNRMELILARDSLGTCPMYYAPLNGGIAFGSILSETLKIASLDKTLNPEALSDYLTYLYIPFPKTIIKGIFKVPPGCFIQWREGNISVQRYFDFDLTMQEVEETQAIDDFEQALDSTVETMCDDENVGLFLSGGIDSTTVLAFADRHTKKPIPSFSLGFQDAPLYDERDRVAFISDHFKTKHYQIDLGSDIVSALPELVKYYDEPFGNSTSLLIYELAREARSHVSTVLTGDGGDEFFAGYPRLAGIGVSCSYRRLPIWLRDYVIDPLVMALPESLDGRHWLRRAREFVKGSRLPLDEMYVNWITYINEEAKIGLFHPEVLSALDGYDARDSILHAMNKYPSNVELGAHYADLAFFLPCNGIEYVSKSTRAHDLAVRSPLLDNQVTSLAVSLPMELKLDRRQPKYLLRQVAKRVLPPQVLKWPKIGFNSPVGIWLKKEPGISMLREFLSPESTKRRGLLNWSSVDALVKEFFRGRRDVSLEVWALMFLEAWCREHID